MENVVFERNEVTKSGGAIKISNCMNVRVRNSVIKKNSASYFGGGVFIEGSLSDKIVFENCQISDNYAKIAGGFSYIVQGKEISIKNSKLVGNSSPKEGAGIFIKEIERFKLEKCEILKHEAEIGSGIFINSGQFLSIKDCIFKDNYAVL